MNTQLVSATNAYVANLGLAYIKLHNLHWNVVGPNFKAVHEYLEALYDGVTDALDETAEVLRQFGHLPVASLKSYLELATISELPDEERSQDATVQIVIADMKTLRAQAAELRQLAQQDDVFHLSNLLEDHIANYDKTLWFLEAMTK